jgi:hypothetical protein
MKDFDLDLQLFKWANSPERRKEPMTEHADLDSYPLYLMIKDLENALTLIRRAKEDLAELDRRLEAAKPSNAEGREDR